MGGIRLEASGFRSNRRNGGVELGLATAGYKDPCAFRCETLGSSEADTSGAAGHDGYFSFESAYHDLSPQWVVPWGQIYGGMLIFKIEMNDNHRCRIVDVKPTGFRRDRDVRAG